MLLFLPSPNSVQVYMKILSSVSAGIPAALAGKIHWIYRALEERGKVVNSAVTRRFLEGTLVKEEVEKRTRTGDW